MSKGRECPACGKPIPSDMFACNRDWFRLPADIRAEINEAWRVFRSAAKIGRSLGQLELAHDRAYRWYEGHPVADPVAGP